MTRQWANNRFACSIAKLVRHAIKKWPIHFNRRVKTSPTRDFNPLYGLLSTLACNSTLDRTFTALSIPYDAALAHRFFLAWCSVLGQINLIAFFRNCVG